MADFSYVRMLDGSVAFVKDSLARSSMCEYIQGTQTGPTSAWTGYSEDDQLRDGKQILFFLPFAGLSNPTLDLTFASGITTGPKDILKNGTEAVPDVFSARTIIRLTWVDVNDAWALDTTASDSITSYDELTNKPMIEEVTLEGNKTFEQLGLQVLTLSEIDAILRL